MPYLTKEELFRIQESRIFRWATPVSRTRVFLSHSHSDKDVVEQVRIFLRNYDAKIYVDYKDPTMPPITNSETAAILKGRIKECSKFIMLASQNALESKWVPWELGFADGEKVIENVALLLLKERLTDRDWIGSEYMGIYSKIDRKNTDEWYIFIPPDYRTGVSLSDWLHD